MMVVVAVVVAVTMIYLRGNGDVGRVIGSIVAAAAAAAAGAVVSVGILYHRNRCDRHVGKLRFHGLYIDVIHCKVMGWITFCCCTDK